MKVRWIILLIFAISFISISLYSFLTQYFGDENKPSFQEKEEYISSQDAAKSKRRRAGTGELENRLVLSNLNSRLSEIEKQLDNEPEDDKGTDENGNHIEEGIPLDPVQQRKIIYQRFENALESQQVDNEWAPGSESEVRTILNTEDFKETSLDSFSCRSTLCKLETKHKDPTARDYFMDRFFFKAYENKSTFGGSWWKIDEGENGELRTTVFLMRKGHEAEFRF